VEVVQTTNGDFPQALATCRKALEISRKLSAADSRSSKGRLALASDYSNLADTTSRLGQKQGANAAISQALTLANELVGLDPKNNEFLGVRAAIYVEAGDVFRRVPDPSKSIFYYREALSEVSQIQSNDPNNVDARLRVAAIRNRVGEMLTRQKDFNGAREMFDKALEMAKPETISAHPNEQALYSTADSYANLAEIDAALAAKGSFTVKERAGHWMNALSLAQQSLKVWSQIKEPGVQSPDGFDCIQASVVSQRLSRYKAASASFHRATEVR
jgi:tetratricopeptide (TPR) repeat protein